MKILKKIKQGDIIEIKWVDTYGYNGWYDEEGINEKTRNDTCKFIGYFIKETKEYFIICMGLENNGDFNPYNKPTWIPRGFIKSIRKLK